MDEHSTTFPAATRRCGGDDLPDRQRNPRGTAKGRREYPPVRSARAFLTRSSWSMSYSTRNSRSTTATTSPSPSLMTAASPSSAVHFALSRRWPITSSRSLPSSPGPDRE